MLRPEVALARRLRRKMRYPEILPWQRLRGGAARAKFRRRHPIGSYVADFRCSARWLVVKVDGEVHGDTVQIGRDAVRDRFLADNRYDVVHINAADILRDADFVASTIAALVERPLHPTPSASGPPPRTGEDQE